MSHSVTDMTHGPVKFKLGSLRLRNAADPSGIVKELIDYCLSCATELHGRNEHLLKENERLRQDWNDMHEQLDKFVSGKEELERGLYTRFTLVLNEKKTKIRSLNQKLSQTGQKVSEKSSSSLPFDTLPIADYSGSMDEESSEVKEETAPPSVSRSQSLLISPDDSTDIAPSRKRRQRGQKEYYTQVKHKPSQLGAPEDQRHHHHRSSHWGSYYKFPISMSWSVGEDRETWRKPTQTCKLQMLSLMGFELRILALQSNSAYQLSAHVCGAFG
ncbi:DNA repair protein XRCC4 isoform X5 [Dendrobates tinctorius]|uniref:DNA repair protein XRCC4 isoform X5 n=1 Tax=Dendrobates tinctorius TaxID=92724 RepID=UPI003CC949D6